MLKYLTVIFIIILGTLFTSFNFKNKNEPVNKAKDYYLNELKLFIKQLESFESELPKTKTSANVLAVQFFKCREQYKKIELFVEYFFPFYATKLNGPPISFYEDTDPDKGQQEPEGLQVIEALLFSQNENEIKKELTKYTSLLLLHSKNLFNTQESFDFNNEFLIDAIIEELYRITAMGIAGFDSQVALNSLPESVVALNTIKEVLHFYKEKTAAQNFDNISKIEKLIQDAIAYINNNKDFNSFNRMEFILNYLNPITALVTTTKKNDNYIANNSPLFYSLINKKSTLFAPNNFDQNKYLDENKTSTERIDLGKELFFEKQLSIDNKRSCASCHQPNKAFTDGLPKSVALDGHSALSRNAPTLWNVALQRNLFYDSRSKTLEEQVMDVLNSTNEMHGSAKMVTEKIIALPKYALLYKKAYPNATQTEAANNICNAIACYQRTLLAFNTAFDKHINGTPSLTPSQISGFNLFMGKAKCGTCHFMPLFNGNKPPRYYYTESEVLGVPKINVKRKATLDDDMGRFGTTGLALHKYAFKTPTLRNIALTAPYMHNGVFNTLEEVIDFYENGGGKGLGIAPINQTLPFDKLKLTKKEKKHLVSFMMGLTDTVGLK